MEKTCSNCKYQEKTLEEEPCVHCGTPGNNFDDYSKWEPKEMKKSEVTQAVKGHSCKMCVHYKEPLFGTHCDGCYNKDSKQFKNYTRHEHAEKCEWCKHNSRDVVHKDSPCSGCGDDVHNWELKEKPADFDKECCDEDEPVNQVEEDKKLEDRKMMEKFINSTKEDIDKYGSRTFVCSVHQIKELCTRLGVDYTIVVCDHHFLNRDELFVKVTKA